MSNEAFWIPVVGESWYKALPGLWDSEYMDILMSHIQKTYSNATVYPDMSDIFRAFKLTPLDKVKVVILGAEPHSDGSATGLAYSISDTTYMVPDVLKRIYKDIEASCYGGFLIDFDYTLESWAKQGVLLLNTSLTVEKFKVNNHFEMWKKFTQTIILGVCLYRNDIHFCLWDENAQSYKKFIDDRAHFIHTESNVTFADINKKLKKKIVW